MSPLKRANKKIVSKKTKSAQKATIKKTSVRSSRTSSIENKRLSTTSRKPSVKKNNESKPVLPPDQQPALIPQPAETTPNKSTPLTNILRVVSLLAVIGITFYIFSIRDHVKEYTAFGYPGIFLIALVANATILIPAPGVAIIYAMGAVFNPLGVGIAAGTGGAIGELSGYLAGFSGQAVIEQANIYNRIKPWVEKYGGWAILILSAIPNPFFDLAGIAAGITKMRMRTFLFFVWIGQLIKMTMFAYAGKYSIEFIARFIK